ncbi:MAG: energy transducer TonB [Bacteroidota bacterium]
MKNSLIIFCAILAAFSVISCGSMNLGHTTAGQEELTVSKAVDSDYQLISIINTLDIPDLFYSVDARFITKISREKLHRAKSVMDILPRKATQPIEAWQSVRVSVLQDNEETDESESGQSEELTPAQLSLLQSTEYGSNFYIKAEYKSKNSVTGILQEDYLTYYISVVPETEAEYTAGPDALIEYLKENSREERTFISKDELKPGQLSFTINQNGNIANVQLNSSSGYASLDQKMMHLINNLPGSWKPATDAKGTTVEQELVFFFGLQGC